MTNSPTDGWELLAAHSNPVPYGVADALSDLGIQVVTTVSREDSTELLAHCPAHVAVTGKPDRRPSFWVNDPRGVFCCFSCGYTGAFVTLVEDGLGISRTDAYRWIVRRGTYRLHETDDTTPVGVGRASQPTEAALALFVPPPPEALAARRVTADACAAYGVLWDPRTAHWILPIRNPDTGVLWGWQEKGKRFFRNHPQGVEKSRSLFGLHQVAVRADRLILLESPLDAVRIASLGITGAVAAFGAYVSEAQMRLARNRCQQLVLALDNDTAGRTSRDKLYSRWRPRGLPIRYLAYGTTTAKDPGEMDDAAVLKALESAHYPWRRV